MSVSIKTNINSVTYGDEMRKLRELQEQYSAGAHVAFTTSGNISYTSLSSGIVYDTSTSSDPNILNKGMQGLSYWLSSLFNKSVADGGYGNNLIDATYLSSIIAAVRDSELIYAADSGSTDAYAISLEVAPTTYTNGMIVNFKANTSNSGGCTLNCNGLGAKAIKNISGNDPISGEIGAGKIVSVIYNGTNFTLLSGSACNDGWQPANETWTYASADAPTFVMTVPSGATSKYSVGMRIKLTQTTVKYFIITAVTSTTLTVYGGTDYTLTNAAISANYYSPVKAPLGFPLDPAKWTVEVTSSSLITLGSASAEAVVNTGISISVPIGKWNFGYDTSIQAGASAGGIALDAALSTSTSWVSTTDYAIYDFFDGVGTLTLCSGKRRPLSLISKTTYYLVIKTDYALTTLYVRGDKATTIINAVCAYL